MEISGEYMFDVPQQLVWDALQDPNVLGAVVPGGQGFEKVGDNQYTGVLLIKVGPVQGTFQGQIALSEINPPESYQIAVEGKGAPGYVKATGKIRLETRGDQTHMEYSGQAQVGGRIASVGTRLIDSSARSIIRQSLEALNEYLKVKAAQLELAKPKPAVVEAVAATAGPTLATPDSKSPVAATPNGQFAAASTTPPPTSVPTYRPPSQMKLALTVARDVFNDFVPAKYRPWLLGAVIVLILLVVWLIVRR